MPMSYHKSQLLILSTGIQGARFALWHNDPCFVTPLWIFMGWGIREGQVQKHILWCHQGWEGARLKAFFGWLWFLQRYSWILAFFCSSPSGTPSSWGLPSPSTWEFTKQLCDSAPWGWLSLKVDPHPVDFCLGCCIVEARVKPSFLLLLF